MTRGAADATWVAAQRARFELAPPRRFLLPALLLLLSEEPGYGYHLSKGLEELRFGRVDRPNVYRALAQLERDGLVESSPGEPTAGQARRVYALTLEGERALRAWMGVIKQERDCLDEVLRRYVATGTVDAVVAEAEEGWAAATGRGWSPVSSTSNVAPPPRRRAPGRAGRAGGVRRSADRRGLDRPAATSLPRPARPLRRADRGTVLRRADHVRRRRCHRRHRRRGRGRCRPSRFSPVGATWRSR